MAILFSIYGYTVQHIYSVYMAILFSIYGYTVQYIWIYCSLYMDILLVLSKLHFHSKSKEDYGLDTASPFDWYKKQGFLQCFMSILQFKAKSCRTHFSVTIKSRFWGFCENGHWDFCFCLCTIKQHHLTKSWNLKSYLRIFYLHISMFFAPFGNFQNIRFLQDYW